MISASAGTAASPARTDADRVAPPATAADARDERASRWSAGRTATTPSQAARGRGQRPVDHPAPAEVLELLGHVAEAAPRAACHHDRPHVTHRPAP